MEITLNFVSGHSICHMVIKNDDQSVVKKDILNEDVANVFSGLSTIDEIYAVPQFLKNKTPDGYVDGLIYGCRGNNNISGIFFIPGGIQYMNFSGEEMVLPYPSCIFYLTASSGVLIESSCFAVKEKSIEELREDTRFYAFPFGNVQSENGSICWGDNNMTGLNNYADLRTAVLKFYSSESNSDYVNPGKSFRGCKTYNEFLKKLRKHKVFPEDHLVLLPEIFTLGHLLDRI